jgi:hypothetical protein
MYNLPHRTGQLYSDGKCHTNAVFAIENLSQDHFKLDLRAQDDVVPKIHPFGSEQKTTASLENSDSVVLKAHLLDPTLQKAHLLDNTLQKAHLIDSGQEHEEVRLNLMNALQNAGMTTRVV